MRMLQPFASRPFSFHPVAVESEACQRWTLYYGLQELAMHMLPDSLNQGEIREKFTDAIESFACKAKASHMPGGLELVEEETGEALVGLAVTRIPDGLSECTPDERYPYWLMTTAQPRRGMPVTLQQFTQLAEALAAPEHAWIAALLPNDVLTENPAGWREPTSWEICHVVGDGSLTGVTGAQAADLIGVTPQSFRARYSAADGAKTRQPIGFATWHLLLHKLGVTRMSRVDCRASSEALHG